MECGIERNLCRTIPLFDTHNKSYENGVPHSQLFIPAEICKITREKSEDAIFKVWRFEDFRQG